MIVLLLVAVVLIVLNGAYVAVEFALLASRRPKLEALAEGGSLRARQAVEATSDLNAQLAGAQLGITVASLLLGFVGEPTVGHLVESAIEPLGWGPTAVHTTGFVVGLAIVVFAHMVFGEMVPKNIALAAPERTLLALTLPARAYLFLARPLITLLNVLANGVVRLLGIEPRDELLDAAEADEIAAMVAASRDEGLIEDVEHQLLTGALDLGVRDVGSVLVPRDQIVRVSRAATAAEAEQVVVDSGHSRLVVVGADVDDVLGYVHAKELLTVPATARARPLPLGRIRRLPVVSPDRPIDDVLLIMQRARVHLALVQDQGGRTVGIVSMEDLLEALVGDIVDETDQPSSGVGQGNGSVTVNHVTRSQ